MLLEGKVLVVTGGAAGIGRATAKHLAAEGAAVVIGDIDEPGARSVAAEIAAAGGRALGIRCDMGVPADITTLVDAAVDELGGLDGVDHNAAWTSFRRDTDAVGVDLEVWDRVLRVNTRGALLLARAAIPHLRRRGGGSIVAISSGSAAIGERTRVAYGVSKAAVEQVVRHLATRYGRDGIRANAVAPGFIETDTAARGVPEAHRAMLAAANPTGRLGTPLDIAQAVAFLLSDRATYVNGQVLRVDGGQTIAGVLPGPGASSAVNAPTQA